jgi:NAD dependent epimerase/dehydratase
LVTGASGFIGSHLVEHLVNLKECEIRILVSYDTGPNLGNIQYLSEEIKNKIEVFVGDIKNSDDVKMAVDGTKVVFHLAALVGIPYSYYHPRSVIDTNLIGTLNVLIASRDLKVEKVVHTSTSEVYGTSKYIPIDENHPLQGQSPYSASKIGADKIAESFYKSYNFPVATIRPFNQYGPRQSTRAVIPTIITQALTQKTIKLGALSPTRDFVFVQDTVNAFVKIAESEKTAGEVINIGTGSEISIGNLAQKIIKITNSNADIICDDSRIRPSKSEVDRLLCNNEKAKKLLGWKPSFSLDQGLLKTIEWMKTYISNYEPEKYAI